MFERSPPPLFFKIVISYGWERELAKHQQWICKKIYRLWKEEDGFRVLLVEDSIYNDARNSIPPDNYLYF